MSVYVEEIPLVRKKSSRSGFFFSISRPMCWCSSVPWWALNPDSLTGYEITYFMLNLFIPSPFVPYYLYLRRVLYHSLWSYCLNHPLATVELVSAVQPQLEYILGYCRFKIWKYGESSKYVRLFRSEQEFGVSRDICEQIVYVVYAPVWFTK